MTVTVDGVRRVRLPRVQVPGSDRLGRLARDWSAAGRERPGGYVLLVATLAVLRIQPSEVAKLALLVFSADVLTRREHELYDWRRVLRPVLLVFTIFAFLVMREPDLDSTIVLSLIVSGVLLIGGVRAKHLGVI